MPTFALVHAPAVLAIDLRCMHDAPLPLAASCEPVASVPDLSPVGSSAQNHLTSELLRTLSMMAASKPTSWLSQRLHILSHLVWIWGP